MAGVRIHHPTLTNAILAVESPTEVYGRGPRWCPLCKTDHQFKTRHVHIDGDGNAIVSETVWDRLRQLMADGMTVHRFIVMNEVTAPPPIRVDFDDPHNGKTVWIPSDGNLKRIYKGKE